MRNSHRVAAILVALATIPILAACGPSSTPKPGRVVSPPTETSVPSPAPSQHIAKMGAEAVKVPMGTSYDGTKAGPFTVQVSAPERYKPSEYAAGLQPDDKTVIKFSVTLVNEGSQAYEPNVTIEVTIGGISAHPVFDTSGGFGDSWGSIIPAGRSLTLKHAYAASTQDASVIDVVVRPMSSIEWTQVAMFRGGLTG